MLALTRREGESILVGDFELAVLEVGEDVVQLRITHSLDPENIFIEMWVGVEEEFRIGKSVLGKIAVIRHNGVGICIEAPRSITILRKEISGGEPTRTRFPGIH